MAEGRYISDFEALVDNGPAPENAWSNPFWSLVPDRTLRDMAPLFLWRPSSFLVKTAEDLPLLGSSGLEIDVPPSLSSVPYVGPAFREANC